MQVMHRKPKYNKKGVQDSRLGEKSKKSKNKTVSGKS